MVASSVVLTVVVLNYHHRTADIYEMPPWVIAFSLTNRARSSSLPICPLDKSRVSAVAAMDSANVATRQEDHKENNIINQPNEGTGAERALIKIIIG